MNISGVIEQNSIITLPRLLERIFDSDQPGKLMLKHQVTGEDAVLEIAHGEVKAAEYNELRGESAVRTIGREFPWVYEFKPIGEIQGNGSLGGPNIVKAPRPAGPVRAVGARVAIARPAGSNGAVVAPPVQKQINLTLNAASPKLPSTEQPAEGGTTPPPLKTKINPADIKMGPPREEIGQRVALVQTAQTLTRKHRPYLRMLGMRYADGKSDTPDQPPTPILDLRTVHTPDTMREWVRNAESGTLRFFDFSGARHGDVSEEEWSYFKADQTFVARLAKSIGGALGYSEANMTVIVEVERSVSYWRLTDGYAGAYRGTDSSVSDFIAKI